MSTKETDTMDSDFARSTRGAQTVIPSGRRHDGDYIPLSKSRVLVLFPYSITIGGHTSLYRRLVMSTFTWDPSSSQIVVAGQFRWDPDLPYIAERKPKHNTLNLNLAKSRIVCDAADVLKRVIDSDSPEVPYEWPEIYVDLGNEGGPLPELNDIWIDQRVLEVYNRLVPTSSIPDAMLRPTGVSPFAYPRNLIDYLTKREEDARAVYEADTNNQNILLASNEMKIRQYSYPRLRDAVIFDLIKTYRGTRLFPVKYVEAVPRSAELFVRKNSVISPFRYIRQSQLKRIINLVSYNLASSPFDERYDRRLRAKLETKYGSELPTEDQ